MVSYLNMDDSTINDTRVLLYIVQCLLNMCFKLTLCKGGGGASTCDANAERRDFWKGVVEIFSAAVSFVLLCAPPPPFALEKLGPH